MEATKHTGERAKAKKQTAENLMRVRKRDGSLEPVDVTKIVRRVTDCSEDLRDIDPHRVAIKAISGLYDGASTKELDNLSIQTAAMLIGEEPQYSLLASRLLSIYIKEEVKNLGVQTFADSVEFGVKKGLIAAKTRRTPRGWARRDRRTARRRRTRCACW